MKKTIAFLLGILIGGLSIAPIAAARAQGASAKPPLFVNMTSADSWRGWMGLHFAYATLKMGHPVTVFLNLDGVKLAMKTGVQEKKPTMQRIPREILADLIRDGAVVLMCGPCMRELGIDMNDLVPGVQMGKPGLTQDFIFADNARILSW